MQRLHERIQTYFTNFGKASLITKMVITSGVGLLLIFLFVIGSSVSARSPEIQKYAFSFQDANAGKTIFEEKCTACHTIGAGKLVGPDLQGITDQRNHDWIVNFILDPAKMIASDPDAQALFKEYNNFTMPNMGLSADQVNQVVAYLSNPGSVPTTPGTPAATTAGDPAVGQRLFSGETHLAKGGPACISCHTVIGTGVLGGGGLGPDLTQVYTRLGEPGLSASLKTLPFPTMMGPFQNRLLTDTEQADLVAFFKVADQTQAPVPVIVPGAVTLHVILIFGIGLVVSGLLFGILWLLWVPLKKHFHPHLPVRKV